MKAIKPVKAWGLVNVRSGHIYAYVVSPTRKGAVAEFCDNGDNYPADEWESWRKLGWRPIRITISPTTPAGPQAMEGDDG